ncbi:MAG: Gfo/Idh/MocA family oxidoreductase [Alphaproteobacteria bacterium]
MESGCWARASSGRCHSLAFSTVHIARISPSVDAKLVALVDNDHALAEEVRQRYRWESVAPDWHTIVADPKVDLFINSGPNDAHAEPTIAAARNGKAVFSEKPLGRTAGEAYAIWEGVEKAGVRHMCAYVHRFVPALRLFRDMVAAGELGRIRHFRSNFLLDMQHPDGHLSWRYSLGAAGGGATGDLGSHHIDQARFLLDTEVRRVFAMSKSWSKDSKGAVTDVNDDWFMAGADLDNGATANFECSRVTEGHALTGRIEADGTKGTLRWDMERVSELTLTEPRKGSRLIKAVLPEHPYSDFWLPVGIQGAFAVGWRDAFCHQAHHMLAAMDQDQPIGPIGATFEDGYKVAEIVDTILRSAESGRAEDVAFRPAPARG